MVHYRTDTTQFFTAAGTSRTAVDQMRDRRTVPGGAAGVLAVEHQDAAVVRGNPGDQFAGNLGIVGAHRSHQRAAATGGEAHGVGQVGVADHRGHRAEGFQRVNFLSLGIRPAEQHRGHERTVFDDALAAVGAGDRRRIQGAVRKLAAGVEHGLNSGADIGQLLKGSERTHGDALGTGITQHHAFLDPGTHGGDDVGHHALRHNGAPDGGALLAGLDGHFGDHGLDEGVELRGALDCVRAQDGGVERIGLRREADAAVHHIRVRLQGIGGGGGAGEGHQVAVVEVVQDGAGRAGDELQRALGQDVGLDHGLDHGRRHVARGSCGLDDGGNTGDEGGRKLLQHAPHREVEGVDLHGDARDAGVDVLAGEGTVAGQHLHGPIHHHLGVGQLAAALGAEGEEHADSAVDVHHGIDLGGAGLGGQLIEVLAAGVEVLRQFLELEGALVESQRAEFLLAGGASVIHDVGKVQSLGAHLGEELAGAGVQDGDGGSRRSGVGRPPGVPDKTGNSLHSVQRGFRSSCSGGHR
ncbi:hypothetical protein D9M72_322290 [compost metagenome]